MKTKAQSRARLQRDRARLSGGGSPDPTALLKRHSAAGGRERERPGSSRPPVKNGALATPPILPDGFGTATLLDQVKSAPVAPEIDACLRIVTGAGPSAEHARIGLRVAAALPGGGGRSPRPDHHPPRMSCGRREAEPFATGPRAPSSNLRATNARRWKSAKPTKLLAPAHSPVAGPTANSRAPHREQSDFTCDTPKTGKLTQYYIDHHLTASFSAVGVATALHRRRNVRIRLKFGWTRPIGVVISPLSLIRRRPCRARSR